MLHQPRYNFTDFFVYTLVLLFRLWRLYRAYVLHVFGFSIPSWCIRLMVYAWLCMWVCVIFFIWHSSFVVSFEHFLFFVCVLIFFFSSHFASSASAVVASVVAVAVAVVILDYESGLCCVTYNTLYKWERISLLWYFVWFFSFSIRRVREEYVLYSNTRLRSELCTMYIVLISSFYWCTDG